MKIYKKNIFSEFYCKNMKRSLLNKVISTYNVDRHFLIQKILLKTGSDTTNFQKKSKKIYLSIKKIIEKKFYI